MKIAIFTPGYYPVCVTQLKAIEQWVYLYSAALTQKGHEVHLFGHPESEGEFILHRLDVNTEAYEKAEDYRYEAYNLVKSFCECVEWSNKNGIDIIHDNTNTFSVYLSRYSNVPVVGTLHGVRPKSNLSKFYSAQSSRIISPSKFMTEKSDLKIDKVIHHGIDEKIFSFNNNPGDNFAILGRIIEGKGYDDAIKVAEKAGVKIKVAGYKPGYVTTDDYYNKIMKMIEDYAAADFVGKVEREEVPKYFGAAKATLFPIKWPEPFGLVMIESMACGTPVIAYDNGAVKEIVTDGETGFVVPSGDIDAMVDAVKKIDSIDRSKCRERVTKLFTFDKMVDSYLDYYREISNE
jgi:glycosyltransferase involved in cell wall biosynthesis